MAGLRALIDCKAVDTADRNDVFNHLKNVKDKTNEADIATLKLHQKLAPAKQLIEMVEQEHPMPGQDDQQQFDEFGNPIMQDQTQPGKQVNPASAPQQNNQALRQRGAMPAKPMAKPGAAKPAAKAGASKSSGNKNKSNSKSKGGKGFEVHIKGKGDKIDQLNVKKGSKRLAKLKSRRYDYHSNPGQGSGAGRGIGLSTSRKIK